VTDAGLFGTPGTPRFSLATGCCAVQMRPVRVHRTNDVNTHGVVRAFVAVRRFFDNLAALFRVAASARNTLGVMSDVTRLLETAAQAGDHQAAANLLPLVYGELRNLAAARMAARNAAHT
jgi:hypothetical protein